MDGRTEVLLLSEDNSFYKRIDVDTRKLSECSLIAYNGMNFSFAGVRDGTPVFRRGGSILVVED